MTAARARRGERATAPARDAEVDYGVLTELLGYHLRRAQARVFDDFMQSVDGGSVTPGQFGVLTLISANSGLSQSALARALGIERSTMVEVIDRLEGQGLVERRPAAHDRRTNALTLTDIGNERLAALTPRVRQHESRMASELNADELRELIRLLRRIGPR